MLWLTAEATHPSPRTRVPAPESTYPSPRTQVRGDAHTADMNDMNYQVCAFSSSFSDMNDMTDMTEMVRPDGGERSANVSEDSVEHSGTAHRNLSSKSYHFLDGVVLASGSQGS